MQYHFYTYHLPNAIIFARIIFSYANRWRVLYTLFHPPHHGLVGNDIRSKGKNTRLATTLAYIVVYLMSLPTSFRALARRRILYLRKYSNELYIDFGKYEINTWVFIFPA